MTLTFPKSMFPHSITIEAYKGDAAKGPVYGAVVTVRCLKEEKRRFVRDSKGNQALSQTTLYCPPGTACPPQSRVTVAGNVCTALRTDTYDAGALPAPGCVVIYVT